MPRRPRYDEAGAVQNIWARGVDRCDIFRDVEDRHEYLDYVEIVVAEFEWDVLARCLMTNHVHLLIRTRAATLSRGMHKLHTLYALHFNGKYERTGHLFERRYGSNRIRSSWRLHKAVDYIAQNPVRARLCATPADWPWSAVVDDDSLQVTGRELDS